MISLISEPSGMKDSDILSYLILGSSTQNNSQKESKLLLETAKNMGIKMIIYTMILLLLLDFLILALKTI